MFLLFVILVLSLADVVLAQLYSPIDVDIEFTSTIDLSDTFHNSIAGPLAVVLVLAFTGILVAGLLQSSVSSTGRSTTEDNLESSWLYRVLSQMEAEKAFDFMGEMKDPCRRKILCHIHNFVPFTPPWLQTIFRVIRDEHSENRNIRGVLRYKEDIVFGLGGGNCDERYRIDCPQSTWQLLAITQPVRQLLKQQRRHPFQSLGWYDRFLEFD